MVFVEETVGVPAAVFLVELGGTTFDEVSHAPAIGAALRAAVAGVAGVDVGSVLISSVAWQGASAFFNDSAAVNTAGNGEAVAGGERRVAALHRAGGAQRARTLVLDMGASANATAMAAAISVDEAHGGPAAAFVVLTDTAEAAGALAGALAAPETPLSAAVGPALSAALGDATGRDATTFAAVLQPSSAKAVVLQLKRRRWMLLWDWLLRNVRLVVCIAAALLVAALGGAAARAAAAAKAGRAQKARAAAARARRAEAPPAVVLVKDAYVDAVRAWAAASLRGRPENLSEHPPEEPLLWEPEGAGAAAPRSPATFGTPSTTTDFAASGAPPAADALEEQLAAAGSMVVLDAERVRGLSKMRAAVAKVRLAKSGKRAGP
jgi:hypothetical protein